MLGCPVVRSSAGDEGVEAAAAVGHRKSQEKTTKYHTKKEGLVTGKSNTGAALAETWEHNLFRYMTKNSCRNHQGVISTISSKSPDEIRENTERVAV